MQPDEIVGIAVLAEMAPGVERLFVTCHSAANRYLHQASLRVHARGTPEPREGHPFWVYTVRGDMLDVTPSLNILEGDDPNAKSKFHNAGNWSVKFVRRSAEDAYTASDAMNEELREKLWESWPPK